MGISKGFTAYWLNYKLIELEWQQVLGLEEMEETYQFLNQVLADSAELDQIEQACAGDGANEDQRLFYAVIGSAASFFGRIYIPACSCFL